MHYRNALLKPLKHPHFALLQCAPRNTTRTLAKRPPSLRLCLSGLDAEQKLFFVALFSIFRSCGLLVTAQMSASLDPEKAFNLKVLKRHDPEIVDIVGHARHVVIYSYLGGQWSRENVCGPLFLVKRASAPSFRIMVMNQKYIEPFVEDVGGEDRFQFEVEEDLLMYSNSHSEDRGIWFYDKEECQEFARLLNLIVPLVKDECREQFSSSVKYDLEEKVFWEETECPRRPCLYKKKKPRPLMPFVLGNVYRSMISNSCPIWIHLNSRKPASRDEFKKAVTDLIRVQRRRVGCIVRSVS
ncbi:uncharacterized protein LOC126316443 isoform X2 [Schistocerca gregaria]|uniref:uncharacterized protein LOC126316443 isoform X2 n=1 Tax=Schistocerca gregaria TaxID=7010 RepID=UPI00211E194A|nr:uncharacterized protein LOC126316443 isoform X2 [Schistocerca gregaria]